MAFWVLKEDLSILRVNDSVMRQSTGIIQRESYTEEGLKALQDKRNEILRQQRAKDVTQFRTSSTR